LVEEHPRHYTKTGLARALGYTDIALAVIEELRRRGVLGPDQPRAKLQVMRTHD
jgi:hypothetical protein